MRQKIMGENFKKGEYQTSHIEKVFWGQPSHQNRENDYLFVYFLSMPLLLPKSRWAMITLKYDGG